MLPQYKDGIYGFRNEFRFLSNFWYVDVEFEGFTYRSTEHAYQAAKTLDRESRLLIRSCKTPGVAKRMGRFIKIRKDWDKIKLAVMQEVSEKKYQNPELAKMLLATGDRYIEETNSWNDTFWGVCNGKGKNHLGLILMGIREKLRDNEPD